MTDLGQATKSGERYTIKAEYHGKSVFQSAADLEDISDFILVDLRDDFLEVTIKPTERVKVGI